MNELQEGLEALKRGDLEQARSALAAAIARAPLNADAYEALATVLEQQGRIEMARNLCETAIGQLPKARFLHRKAVELNVALEDYESAERAACMRTHIDEHSYRYECKCECRHKSRRGVLWYVI